MYRFILLAALVHSGVALCTKGDKGEQGNSLNVTAVTVATAKCASGGYNITVIPTGTVIGELCHGNTGAQGPTGATGAAGAAGATGATGAAGADGADGADGASINTVTLAIGSDQCANGGVNLTNSITGAVLNKVCNGATGPQGSQGNVGPQGPQGPSAALVVDGTTYPLTRTGIQTAITAAAAGSIGSVIVKGDVTSDGTALTLASNVILDFDGHIFKAPSGNSNMNLIATFSSGGTNYVLGSDVAAGSSSVNVSTDNIANFAAGDMVSLAGTSNGGFVFVTVVQAVNTTSGFLELHEHVTNAFLVSEGAFLVRFSAPLKRTGLRRVILDGNGNTGTGSKLLLAAGVMYSTFEDIVVTGTVGIVAPNNILRFVDIYGCQLINIHSRNMEVCADCRDIAVEHASSMVIHGLTSRNCGGFGPVFNTMHHSTVTDVIVARSKSRGLRIDACTENTFTNIVSNNNRGVNGDGVRVAFGSHHNTFHGVETSGNAEFGLVFGGGVPGGDSNNQVYGLNSRFNGDTNLYFLTTTLNENNYVQGDADGSFSLGTVGTHNTFASVVTDIFTINSDVDSTTAATGSLIVKGGGAGIEKALVVGGRITTGIGLHLPTTGGTPATFSYYEEYSHVTNVTGPWTTPLIDMTFRITRIGRVVTLEIPHLTGTAGQVARVAIVELIPVRFRPPGQRSWGGMEIANNGVFSANGFARMQSTGGLLEIFTDGTPANFAGTGTATVFARDLTWQV